MYIRLLLLSFLNCLFLAASLAYALGGDNTQPLIQVNSDSKVCSDGITAATRVYINTRATVLASCFSAYIACDQSATSITAAACRAGLLTPGTGLCARDKVDSGISTTGAVSRAVYTAAKPALLDVALRTFITSVHSACFTSGSPDLSSEPTGLGFNPEPYDAYLAVDRVNVIPGGASCHVQEVVRASNPLADEIIAGLQAYDNTCIAVDGGYSLYTPCTTNTQCGPSAGVCGKLAYIFNQGSSGQFYSCPISCQPGQRRTESGICVPCGVGTFSSTTNATSCTTCLPGTYNDTTGATSCISCGFGTSSSAGSSLCNNCAIGRYASSAGESSCSQCSPGTIAPLVGTKSCTDCSPGTFASGSGSSLCTSCPSGKFSAAGATSCSDCAAGTLSSTTGSGVCATCPKGTYSAAGSSSCLGCPLGSASADAGSSTCTQCTPGRYSAVVGAQTCQACPPGRASGAYGASSCDGC